ncbi:MAG: hypothetical protein Q8O67_16475 [Deltaproteobacteria bacterium]|nr:hypothetical protein [Deltaproteobacteria bacterium]
MGRLVIALAALWMPAAAMAAPTRAPKQQQQRILVMDVAGAALTREEAGLVRDALATEIAQRTRAEVLSSEDVRRVLDATADKQQMDCETDVCLAELGAALGASRVVHGTVARLGARYVMTVALIDPDNARALGRATAKTESFEELYDSVPLQVSELLGKYKRKADDDGGGFPLLTVSGTSLSVLGLAGAGVSGGYLYYLYSTSQNPDGDAAVKQDFLTYQQDLGIAAGVSAGVVVVGALLLTVGLIVD